MTSQTQFSLIEYEHRYARDSVTLWRDSKEKAIGKKEIHSVDDHLYFLNEILAKENVIYLTVTDTGDKVVGFMATDGKFINQLYVHNDFQRRGIGSKLLQLAKENSSGKLQLFTFEVNSGAQAFYEKHGFVIVGRGNDNEEMLPDILYEWSNSEAGMT